MWWKMKATYEILMFFGLILWWNSKWKVGQNSSCPGSNSIKKLQVNFTSLILVSTSPHKSEFNKSLYKFPLQASNLYIQWYLVEYFSSQTLHVHYTIAKKKYCTCSFFIELSPGVSCTQTRQLAYSKCWVFAVTLFAVLEMTPITGRVRGPNRRRVLENKQCQYS